MSSTRVDATWTREEADALVRQLWDALKPSGFYVALTGSVLYRGESAHDLDLIVYPAQSTGSTDFFVARDVLKSAGMRQFLNSETVRNSWRRKGSMDEKTVEVWEINKKRVDIFFLR